MAILKFDQFNNVIIGNIYKIRYKCHVNLIQFCIIYQIEHDFGNVFHGKMFFGDLNNDYSSHKSTFLYNKEGCATILKKNILEILPGKDRYEELKKEYDEYRLIKMI